MFLFQCSCGQLGGVPIVLPFPVYLSLRNSYPVSSALSSSIVSFFLFLLFYHSFFTCLLPLRRSFLRSIPSFLTLGLDICPSLQWQLYRLSFRPPFFLPHYYYQDGKKYIKHEGKTSLYKFRVQKSVHGTIHSSTSNSEIQWKVRSTRN